MPIYATYEPSFLEKAVHNLRSELERKDPALRKKFENDLETLDAGAMLSCLTAGVRAYIFCSGYNIPNFILHTDISKLRSAFNHLANADKLLLIDGADCLDQNKYPALSRQGIAFLEQVKIANERYQKNNSFASAMQEVHSELFPQRV